MAASSDPRIKLTSALTRAKRIATGCTRPAATPFTSSSSEAQEPSVIPPQLDAIRMRARTLTAFSTPLHLADFSNPRLIPSPPSVESLPKSSASPFRIFHSLFLCESCDHRGQGIFECKVDGYIRTRCGEMEILDNCRWNKNGSTNGYD